MSSMKMKCWTEIKMKRYISTKGIKIKTPDIHMGMDTVAVMDMAIMDAKVMVDIIMDIITVMEDVKEDAKDTGKANNAKVIAKRKTRGDERKEDCSRS